MTPYWLCKHAEISGSYTVCLNYLEISSGTTIFGRAIRVQLVPPKSLSEEDVTVTITVAMDVDSNNHDPVFGINDGSSFVGFYARDNNHYSSYAIMLKG